MNAEHDPILVLERRRCAAIADGDFAALADCLADDYLHVFGGGKTCGKAAYIKTVTDSPRAPERSNLVVRRYGDAAVLSGDLLNRITPPGEEPRIVDTFATQVAIRQDGKWRFVSFQITQKRK